MHLGLSATITQVKYSLLKRGKRKQAGFINVISNHQSVMFQKLDGNQPQKVPLATLHTDPSDLHNNQH